MNIYKIYQNVNNDYYTYDSAIVAAPTRKYAQTLNPGYNRTYEWCEIEDVQVEYIGETSLYKVPTVILTSYNAG